jgi:hypothetical protein
MPVQPGRRAKACTRRAELGAAQTTDPVSAAHGLFG